MSRDTSSGRLLAELLKTGVQFARSGNAHYAEQSLDRAVRLAATIGRVDHSRALGTLGTLYAREGRRFEAVLLYRTAASLAAESGDALLAVRQLSNLGAVFVELEQWAELLGLMEEIDGLVSGLGISERTRADAFLPWLRWHVAFRAGDYEACSALLPRVRRLVDGLDDASSRVVLQVWEASLLLRQGALEEAHSIFESASARPYAGLAFSAEAVIGRIKCLYALNRSADAVNEARKLLLALEAVGYGRKSAAWRGELAAELGACLERVPPDGSASKRAYGLAASDVLSRLSQLASVVPELDGIASRCANTRALAGRMEATYLGQHQAVLGRVLRLLESDRSLLDTGRDPHNCVWRICAWCGLVRTLDGAWLPVGEAIRRAWDANASHGICPSCATEQAGRIGRQDRSS